MDMSDTKERWPLSVESSVTCGTGLFTSGLQFCSASFVEASRHWLSKLEYYMSGLAVTNSLFLQTLIFMS